MSAKEELGTTRTFNGIKYYTKKEGMKEALTKPEDNYVLEFMDRNFCRRFTFIPKTKNFFTEIKKLMHNKNYYITEIMLNGVKRKPFIDYDREFETKEKCDKVYSTAAKQLIDDLITVFKKEYNHKLKTEDFLILDGSRQKKDCYRMSIHLIISPKDKTFYYTDNRCTDSSAHHMCTSLIKLNTDSKDFVDPQVYRSDGTLRIIGSAKDESNSTILMPIDSETFKPIKLTDSEKLQYLTTHIDTDNLIKLETPSVKNIKNKKTTIIRKDTPPTTNFIKKLTKLVRKYRSDAEYNDYDVYGHYNFQYFNREDPCPISGTVHSGTNRIYCYETDRGIYMNCYSTSCKDKGSIYLGTIDEEDKFIHDAIQINQQYLMESNKMKNIIDKWLSKKHLLAVKSAMGTGKTVMVREIVQNKKFKKILWITHRQTLTRNIYGEFKKYGFVNYMDEDGSLYSDDRVIVQIDSLMRIAKINEFKGEETFQKYDLVIIDEVEGALAHFSSPYLRKPDYPAEHIFDNMFKLLTKSKKVLLLDADLGIRSKHLIEDIKNDNDKNRSEPIKKNIVVNNSYEPVKKTFNIISEKDSFKNYLMKDLTSGLKVCVVSMSSGYLENIAIEIDALNKKKKYLGKKIKPIKYVMHTSKTDDKLKVKLENVNKFWTQYDLVLYSPTIESGVDFNKKHFDKIYGIIVDGPMTCSQRSFLQMIGRIRNVECQDVLCLYEKMYQVIKNPPVKKPVKKDPVKKPIKKQGSKTRTKKPSVKKQGSKTRTKKPPVKKNVERKLVLDANIYTFKDLVIYFKHFETLNGRRILRRFVYETIDRVDNFTTVKEHAEMVLFDIINLYNEAENLNKHHAIFATVLQRLIIKAGHKVTFDKVERCEEGEFIVDIAKRKARIIESMVAIDETKYDMKELQTKKLKSDLTKEEKIVLDKVHFKKTFGIKDVPKEEMKKQFNIYYGKETKLSKVELLLKHKKLPDFDKDTFPDGKERTRNKVATDLIKKLVGKKEGKLQLEDINNIVIPQKEYVKALKNIVNSSIYFKNPEAYRCLYFKSKSRSTIRTNDEQFQIKCTHFLKSILATYGIILKMMEKKKGIKEFQYSLCVDKHIVDILERKYYDDIDMDD